MVLFIKKYNSAKDNKPKMFLVNTSRKILWEVSEENVTVDSILPLARTIDSAGDYRRLSMDFSMLESFLENVPKNRIRRSSVKSYYQVYNLDLIMSRVTCYADTVTELFIPDNEVVVLRLEQLIGML